MKKHGERDDGQEAEEGEEEGNYSNPNSKDGHDGVVHLPVAATIIYGEEGEPVHPPESYSGGDDTTPGGLKSIYDGGNNNAFKQMMNPFVAISPSESHHNPYLKQAQESTHGFTNLGPGSSMPNFDSFGDFAPPMFGSKVKR